MDSNHAYGGNTALDLGGIVYSVHQDLRVEHERGNAERQVHVGATRRAVGSLLAQHQAGYGIGVCVDGWRENEWTGISSTGMGRGDSGQQKS